MTDTLLANRNRRSWALMAVLMLMLVAATGGIGAWWYHSTADLDAVRTAAQTQNVPTTWAELRQHISAAEQLAQFKRLTSLSKTLKDYDSELVLGKIAGDKVSERLRAFLPVPARAVDFHANLDPSAVQEALTIIDNLPNGPLALTTGDPKDRPKDKIGTYRQAVRWLNERILMAEEPAIFTEVERTLRLIESYDVTSMIDGLIKDSLVSIILPSIAARLPALRSQVPALSMRLERLAKQLLQETIDGLSGDFIEGLESTTDPWRLANTPFIGGEQWWAPYYDPLRVRGSRAPWLHSRVNQVVQVRTLISAHEFAGWSFQQKQAGERLREWHPAEWLTKINLSALEMTTEIKIRVWVHIQLLLAEMKGETWPTDPFDPARHPVRQLKQRGQVIGAYSVGKDGVDDGGDRGKDCHLLLYGRWEAPTKGTPTE